MADVKSISDSHISPEPQMMGVPNSQMVPNAPPNAQPAGAHPQPAAARAQQAPEQGQHMIPIPNPQAQSAPAQRPEKVQVKPETKGNEAVRAKLSKGNINDAAMSQGLINTLNKEGAKAGMGS